MYNNKHMWYNKGMKSREVGGSPSQHPLVRLWHSIGHALFAGDRHLGKPEEREQAYLLLINRCEDLFANYPAGTREVALVTTGDGRLQTVVSKESGRLAYTVTSHIPTVVEADGLTGLTYVRQTVAVRPGNGTVSHETSASAILQADQPHMLPVLPAKASRPETLSALRATALAQRVAALAPIHATINMPAELQPASPAQLAEQAPDPYAQLLPGTEPFFVPYDAAATGEN